MPMVAMIASGSITGTSGIAGGAPTRLITTATQIGSGNNLKIESGLYSLYWSFTTVTAASGAASAQIPVFTWYDDTLAAGITATGGAYGSLVNGLVTASLTGAAGISSLYALSGAASSQIRGNETFFAGSGASGASAYVQVSAVASNGGVARYKFDYAIFRLDLWAV